MHAFYNYIQNFSNLQGKPMFLLSQTHIKCCRLVGFLQALGWLLPITDISFTKMMSVAIGLSFGLGWSASSLRPRNATHCRPGLPEKQGLWGCRAMTPCFMRFSVVSGGRRHAFCTCLRVSLEYDGFREMPGSVGENTAAFPDAL